MYVNAMWLTGNSSGNTTRCAYIGSSMDQSWFAEVVLRSGLRGTMSVHLVVRPCKGYSWMPLNLPKSLFNKTNYKMVL